MSITLTIDRKWCSFYVLREKGVIVFAAGWVALAIFNRDVTEVLYAGLDRQANERARKERSSGETQQRLARLEELAVEALGGMDNARWHADLEDSREWTWAKRDLARLLVGEAT